MMKVYSVNDVAKVVGVHSHAIILAEKEGRIPAARRDELGARVYDEADLERLTLLMRAPTPGRTSTRPGA